MRILHRVTCTGRDGVVAGYYATIELDDGATLELSSRKPLDDEAWFALATSIAEEQAKPEPEPEPTVEVECEDGAFV
jgi:hypothetical protein